jgi:hypothetical protein
MHTQEQNASTTTADGAVERGAIRARRSNADGLEGHDGCYVNDAGGALKEVWRKQRCVSNNVGARSARRWWSTREVADCFTRRTAHHSGQRGIVRLLRHWLL